MHKIVILGSGAMGTACAKIIKENGYEPLIYGINENELKDLENGKNEFYFPNVSLPFFKTTSSLEETIKDADFIVISVPSAALNSLFPHVLEKLTKKVILINTCKGFWPQTTSTIHYKLKEISKNYKNVKDIVTLIGPSFAEEIVKNAITFVSGVSENLEAIQEVQKVFANTFFKILAQQDVTGAEIGSIYKNIIAIASGMLAGLGYNINTQAALITLSLREIRRFNKIAGGEEKTLFGLTCLGDLILTATSDKSRNYTFGKNYFLKNEKSSKKTVEGLASIKTIFEKYVLTNIVELPIVRTLYNILFLNKNPNECIKNLLKISPNKE
ncbi:NAD(P)H-dependent glycerol-3-phosphate dehydrogenase [Metamycoplasma hyosynoviae]|uniref:NAD(P)H-dependent glycerol-3-phosphate dehydrogenase n=1 Tax=Metamycoplasma hyosynoviae TaxID=29559 RepID=UPI0023585580|nr:NAD(P)H-dependent glycerol-3-phosphate dehydrogenase [Metamycoplasma hyosynoviae]MDC8920284.1 NAD(P)H-dependent glycerol-3-phosphate dehydrogenase [Metamycoplasma hyosynoviae]MDC8963319.1 NAD(P)H-dependent glycerol-3-phosphate dehydrogenase [Metamycoplasma hyosynoviae]MDD1377666.1 NAD(P)H-dependent glycerol-3-phosphate dehydrogenase [Metamycoplasma hyosynoviae]MDD7894960.1 NAD(P)H-dependent glycerol-3-phosphate dehydrogenase [Metamycoplasma hyosynoviae]